MLTRGANMRIARPGMVFARGTSAAFAVTINGLTNGEAIIGDHASIGYTTDPVSATETVKWSNSADPAVAATYGTGANPTDYTAGDEGRLYLHVTDGGETVTRSALIRYARGTAPSVNDGREFILDDLRVPAVNCSASGDNLTFTYAISGLPEGTINVDGFANAEIPYTGTTTRTGTATVIATDQYGLDYTDTFTWTATLRDQATAAGTLAAISFTQDTGVQTFDASGDFTVNGNDATYSVTSLTGVSINSSTALISVDTDTAPLQSGTSVTVTLTDEYGRETDSTTTLEIAEASANIEDDLTGGTTYAPETALANGVNYNIDDPTVLAFTIPLSGAGDGVVFNSGGFVGACVVYDASAGNERIGVFTYDGGQYSYVLTDAGDVNPGDRIVVQYLPWSTGRPRVWVENVENTFETLDEAVGTDWSGNNAGGYLTQDADGQEAGATTFPTAGGWSTMPAPGPCSGTWGDLTIYNNQTITP